MPSYPSFMESVLNANNSVETTQVKDIPNLSRDKMEKLVADYHRDPRDGTTVSKAIVELCQRVIRVEKDLDKTLAEVKELKDPTPKDANGKPVVLGQYYFVKNYGAIMGCGFMNREGSKYFVDLGGIFGKYCVGHDGITFHHTPKP